VSVEIIRYRIPPGEEAAFEAAYAEAQRHLAASAVCRSYELLRCEEEPDRYLLRIEWTSTTDHLQGFRRSAEFPPFLALVRPFIHAVEEMQHYALTSVGGTGGAGRAAPAG
jgi:quinol monooxygenase YgiN